MVPGEGRPRLVSAWRKCLTFYFYFLDRKMGLMRVRIQSWFPLSIQVCINDHELLARKLDRHRIAYRKEDNAFTWIADVRRADGSHLVFARLLGEGQSGSPVFLP